MDALTLSPAKKAWLTRRARALEAASAPSRSVVTQTATAIVRMNTDADLVTTRVYREPEMVQVEELQTVQIDLLDDPVVGNGRRLFVVLALSSKRARLFYPPTLQTTEIGRDVFDKYHVPVGPRRANRQRLADSIRGRIKLADSLNAKAQAEVLPDGGADAQRVLSLLGK